jgi:hypothetical protein
LVFNVLYLGIAALEQILELLLDIAVLLDADEHAVMLSVLLSELLIFRLHCSDHAEVELLFEEQFDALEALLLGVVLLTEMCIAVEVANDILGAKFWVGSQFGLHGLYLLFLLVLLLFFGRLCLWSGLRPLLLFNGCLFGWLWLCIGLRCLLHLLE